MGAGGADSLVRQPPRGASPWKPWLRLSQALISAVPVPDPEAERSRRRIRIPGELPSPLDPRASLRFLRSRLDAGEEDYVPQLRDVGGGHLVAEHDPLDRLLARAEG